MLKQNKFYKSFFIVILGFTLLFIFSAFTQLEAVSGEYLKVLKWRSIGPHRGGRVVAVTGHPTKKNVFYFGGTGLLIVVGVALDTLQQIEAHLITRHYDGFGGPRGARMRGRRGR